MPRSIDSINRTRAEHILTIEDPIEFLHAHHCCIVNQREVGFDTPSFAEALRAALRQDPDVLLVGEMRDLETIATALTAAETGHLVFATLHTQSAPQTIDRVIDVFPAEQQDQVRIQLAAPCQGVVSQTLVPTADHFGRVAALEILLPDDAVRNLIRQGKVEQLYSVIQTSTSRGMQTMEQSLADLMLRGVITREAALARTTRPEHLDVAPRPRRHPQRPAPARGCRPPAGGGLDAMVDLHKELKLSDLIPKLPERKNRPAKVQPAKKRPLPNELVGLKIEAGSLTAAHVINNGGKKFARVAHAPLAQGIVAGGEVRDPAALATALNELFEGSGLPRRGVRLGLANTRIGVRVIDIPDISDAKQLENAIGFRAHEILSAPLEQAVLDHHVHRRPRRTTRATPRTRCCSCSRSATPSTATSRPPTPRTSRSPASTWRRSRFSALRSTRPHARRPPAPPTVAASIDYDLTTLAISDGSTCQFTRVLEWGAGNVDHGLVRTLKVTAAEAAELRSKVSLETPPQGGSPTGAPTPPDPADIVRHELQTLARELQSSIRFYGSQPGRPPGPRASSSRARSPTSRASLTRLASYLGLTVNAADPFARVELGPDVTRPGAARAASSPPSASGSRTEMRAVNLLPADRHDAKKGSGAGPNQRSLLVACTIASVALIGGLVFMVWSVELVGQQQAEAARSSPGGDRRRLRASSAPAATATDRRATVAGLVGDRLAWDQFLQTFSKVHARGRLGDEPRGRRQLGRPRRSQRPRQPPRPRRRR